MNEVVGLIDMQSFYASCEVASRPEFAKGRGQHNDNSDPALVVAGDPERRSGIILAATPPAKAVGITTAMRLGEALRKTRHITVVRPRMAFYLQTSIYINMVIKQAFPVCEQYSVDESFFSFPFPSDLFPDPIAAAKNLKDIIWDCFRIRCRVGLAENKWMAKMANRAAKRHPDNIVWWKKEDVPTSLHPLSVYDMWGLKRRAEALERKFGAKTIGDVACIPEEKLRRQFGVWGTIIHRWSNGDDASPMNPNAYAAPHKGFSQRTTLPRDFYEKEEIAVAVLELLDELCLRARLAGQKGRRVGLGLTYEGFEGGFYRAKTLSERTDETTDLYPHVLALLDRYWDGSGVRAIGVSLDLLEKNMGEVQLSLFENRNRRKHLTQAVDNIRLLHGETSLMRAASLLRAGQLRDRSNKIGGHFM